MIALATCLSAGDPTATGTVAALPTLPSSDDLTATIETGHPDTASPTRLAPAGEETEESPKGSPPASPTPSRPSPPAGTPPPLRGGEITVGGLDRLESLNPLLAETETERALGSLLFDSLLDHDPNSGRPIPRLAQAWLVSDEGETITFTLRTDARWHDGKPVLANDVVFTLNAVRDPALDSLYGPQLEHVTDVRAIDDATVVIQLDQADCPSLDALGDVPILPRGWFTGTQEITTSPGSGPFLLSSWDAEGDLQLRSNADYWGEVPYLDTLRYHFFETSAGLEQAVEGHEVDVALMPRGYIPEVKTPSDSFQVYRYPAGEFLFVAFNNDHPVLSDARIRLALSMAVDREELLSQTLGGAGDLVPGSLPASHWAADPALEPPPYDPEAARRLLLEAGWSDTDGDGWLDRDGERLRLPVRTNGGNRLREDVAILIAGTYRAIGIDASVELVIWGAVVDDLFTHDFEVIVFSWPLRPEPDQSRWWLSTENEIGSGYNFVSFADEEVDALLEEARSVPGCDPTRRALLYREVQHILADERPYDFLFIPYAAAFARSDLRGLAGGTFGHPLESAADWYLTPATGN